MDRRQVEIAKWLHASGIELETAAVITGMPERRLERLRSTLARNIGRALLPRELDVVIPALGASLLRAGGRQ